MLIDEKTLRLETFDADRSAPVAFPGGVFHLPKPVYRLRPLFQNGKRVGETSLVADDPAFERLKEAIVKAVDNPEADFYGLMVDLAVYMLSKNYALTDDHLGLIFGEEVNHVGESSWKTELMAIAHGNAPKTSVVG